MVKTAQVSSPSVGPRRQGRPARRSPLAGRDNVPLRRTTQTRVRRSVPCPAEAQVAAGGAGQRAAAAGALPRAPGHPAAPPRRRVHRRVRVRVRACTRLRGLCPALPGTLPPLPAGARGRACVCMHARVPALKGAGGWGRGGGSSWAPCRPSPRADALVCVCTRVRGGEGGRGRGAGGGGKGGDWGVGGAVRVFGPPPVCVRVTRSACVLACTGVVRARALPGVCRAGAPACSNLRRPFRLSLIFIHSFK